MLEMRAIVMLLRNHTFYNDTYEKFVMMQRSLLVSRLESQHLASLPGTRCSGSYFRCDRDLRLLQNVSLASSIPVCIPIRRVDSLKGIHLDA